MSINFLYDKLNDFGTVTEEGDFPNVMAMGDASIERMAVDLKLPDGPITGGPVMLSVEGSDTEDGDYAAVVTGGEVSADDLNADGYSLPVPRTKFKFLKAYVSGEFAGGKIQALVNSYIGK